MSWVLHGRAQEIFLSRHIDPKTFPYVMAIWWFPYFSNKTPWLFFSWSIRYDFDINFRFLACNWICPILVVISETDLIRVGWWLLLVSQLHALFKSSLIISFSDKQQDASSWTFHINLHINGFLFYDIYMTNSVCKA